MMRISIFCVVLLAGIFSSTTANTQRSKKMSLTDSPYTKVAVRRYPEKIAKVQMCVMNISFLYEVDKRGNSWFNEKKIRKIVKLTNEIFHVLILHLGIKIEIEEIRPFTTTGKPLAKYNANDLYKFLKKNTLFNKIKPKTDTTQILATGIPGRDQRIAASTFETICSKKSRGIIIEREKDISHVSKLLTYNLACSAGIYNHHECRRGFSEEDMTCEIGISERYDYLFSLASYFNGPEHCYLGKLGWSIEENWKKNKKLCGWNRSIRLKKRAEMLSVEGDNEEEEDDGTDTRKIIYIILAVVGVLVVLAAIVGIWLWKINRDKTKMLTKKRVSVKYKYDPMTRSDRPSIITDPTVTNDLE